MLNKNLTNEDKKNTYQIYSCEVCGSKKLNDVLSLGLQPMCDDLIPIESNLTCKEYPIDIIFCEKCNTAHQKWQINKEILFPQEYHYRARMTSSVINFMREFCNAVHNFSPIKEDSVVVDVGCNDGSLLNFFKAKGAKTIGVEPTKAALDAKENHFVEHGFFDISLSEKMREKLIVADYITFTNVFAHIEDLESLCLAVNNISKDETLIVIENHYLGSVIKKFQFDTFYHEHPRTYSAKSFVYIAQKLKKELLFIEFPERYGGNIRAYIGLRKHHKLFPNLNLPDESNFSNKLLSLQPFISEWKKKCLNMIKNLVEENNKKPIAAKAFPGRAAILIKLLSLDNDSIEAVYEIKGSIKTGNFVPGTRIPILPEKELYESKYNGPILNLAWHLPFEVRENLLKNGFKGRVYDILSNELIQN